MVTLLSNPRALVYEANSRYRNCWDAIGRQRALLLSHAKLPPYCFLPFDFCGIALSQTLGTDKYSHQDQCAVAGLAAWRVTQGVYRFDDALYRELVEMEIGPLPAQVLTKLPEWCIYVELKDERMKGFFAYIDHQLNSLEDTLCLLVVSEKRQIDRLSPYRIPLIGSLMDGVAKHKEFIDNYLAKSGRTFDYSEKFIADYLSPMISLVLYICSSNADMNGKPVRPRPIKSKGAPRWLEAKNPTVWEVGYRVGPALGLARRLATERNEAKGLGSSVRPHVRRAHNHHYWIGQEGNKELILKWLAPIFVNVDDPEQLATTIRPVL